MSAPRRIVALAATVLTLCGPAAALAQSGAGDEQYSDPLAGSTQTSTSGSSSSGSSSGDSSSATNPLGQAPPTTGTSTTGTTGTTGSSTTGTPATTTGSLPNTGADPRVLALLGLALLLAGVGLRLRTRDAGR